MPLTCLIAAHDPWLIQLIRMFVEESGLRAVQVYAGQDVLSMVRQEHPVLVLMQADLPGTVRSRDVLRDLQGDPDMGEIPVLLMLPHPNLREDQQHLEMAQHAAATLSDPITYDAFQDALRKAGIRRPGARLESHKSSDIESISPTNHD